VGRWRHILSCLAILASLTLLMPAAAVASGPGSSAGDQQYVDPFGGSTTPTSHPSPTPAPTIAQPTAVSTTTTTVVASATAPAASSDPSPTLPRTGLDVSLTVAVGLGLLAGGLALRRTARRA
jgi:LPXTG-motif cell wall-anchored protein